MLCYQASKGKIQYNKPPFLCFIDLEKAFDKIRLQDIVYLLYDRQNANIRLIENT